MSFINAKKRKIAEDTQSANYLNKSLKRHHSDHAPISSIGPSTDQAPAVKSKKAGPSKDIAQKRKISSSSLSSLDEDGISIADSTDADADAASTSPSEGTSGEGDESAEEGEENPHEEPRARNKKKDAFKADDPGAFASSMSAILGSKLTKTQRENPILVRSADAKEAEEALLDLKLEKEARREMKRKKELEEHGMNVQPDGEGAGGLIGGHFPTNDSERIGSVAAYQQREKELRKTAQKGVIKMFNAFTHVREKTAEVQGLVGSRAKKEQRATEMTKEGWLEYVGLGGKGNVQQKEGQEQG